MGDNSPSNFSESRVLKTPIQKPSEESDFHALCERLSIHPKLFTERAHLSDQAVDRGATKSFSIGCFNELDLYFDDAGNYVGLAGQGINSFVPKGKNQPVKD